MKKSLVLASLLLVGSTSVMAASNGVYVGADIGSTHYDGTVSARGTSATTSESDGSQTLKVGYYLDTHNRIDAFYQHINIDDGKAYTTGIGYDYLIGENKFKPFVGAILGYGSAKDDAGTLNISGTIYGAQAGLNYSINDNFSVEAGYRYMKSNMDDDIVVSGVNFNVEIDPISNWFVGVNYKF